MKTFHQSIHWTILSPQKRNDSKVLVNVRWYLCQRTTVLFDEFEVSIPISIGGCASQLNVRTTTQPLVPDINMLAAAKECLVSSSRSAMNK